MKRCRHPKRSCRGFAWPLNGTADVAADGELRPLAAWCEACGSLCVWWTDNRRRWLRPAQSAAEEKGKDNGDC